MKTLNDIQLESKDRLAIENAVRVLKDSFPVVSVTLLGFQGHRSG